MEADHLQQQLRGSMEFFSVEGRRVEPDNHAYYRDANNVIGESVIKAEQDATSFGIDHPNWFAEADNSARAFMGSLGFTCLRVMVLYPENEELLEEYSLTGSTIAIADPFLPYLAVRHKKAEALYQVGGQEMVGALIVHELSHDTTSTLDRIVVRDKGDGAQWVYRTGLATVDTRNNVRGDFLEEGFAHYLFGWYRRSLRADYTMRVLGIAGMPEPVVPDYYLSSVAKTAGPDGYAIELLAWGLEQHGHMSANDFIGTLLDSRRLETRTVALRAIAQAINKLQPGLYMALSRLTYSVDDWNRGLGMVHDAATQSVAIDLSR